jgi:xanthine dehydrogenase iron-sulfur cluster and FAD-binding subunit A
MSPFSYTRPTTVADAVQAMAIAGPDARFLAGGTSLYDLMKLDVEAPRGIIDINALTELSGFDTSSPSELVFGAMSRMSDVAADDRLLREYPALSESLSSAATYCNARGAPISAAVSRSPAINASLGAAVAPNMGSIVVTPCSVAVKPA